MSREKPTFDELVCAHIFKWSWKDRPKNTVQQDTWAHQKWPVFSPTGYTNYTVPNYHEVEADYSVLAEIRGTWSEDKITAFGENLIQIWERRAARNPRTRALCESVLARMYNPGDYASAALETLGVLPKSKD